MPWLEPTLGIRTEEYFKAEQKLIEAFQIKNKVSCVYEATG